MSRKSSRSVGRVFGELGARYAFGGCRAHELTLVTFGEQRMAPIVNATDNSHKLNYGDVNVVFIKGAYFTSERSVYITLKGGKIVLECVYCLVAVLFVAKCGVAEGFAENYIMYLAVYHTRVVGEIVILEIAHNAVAIHIRQPHSLGVGVGVVPLLDVAEYSRKTLSRKAETRVLAHGRSFPGHLLR